jgi:hypothetical protein
MSLGGIAESVSRRRGDHHIGVAPASGGELSSSIWRLRSITDMRYADQRYGISVGQSPKRSCGRLRRQHNSNVGNFPTGSYFDGEATLRDTLLVRTCP